MKTCINNGRKFRKYGPRKPVFRRAIALLVLILSAAATCANASPTIAVNGRICPPGHAGFSKTAHVLETFESTDTRLINIGREITKPYIASAISSDSQYDDAESLPAVPTAGVMVLVGLFCVSLIRDRRIWLAGLISVLSAWRAGGQVVPKLSHLRVPAHANKDFSVKSVKSYLFKNAARARCDIEGTRYIDLVKYLTGIPNVTPVVRSLCRQFDSAGTFAKTKGRYQSHQYLVTSVSFFPVSAASRTVLIGGGSIHFKSFFIVQASSRGPPDSALL